VSDTTPKPKLEQCLENLTAQCRQLREVSQAYQQMKALLQKAIENPASIDTDKFSVVMTIPGTNFQVPLPMTGNAEQIVGAIETGAAALGEQVVALWAEAHQVTSEAHQHCQAAAQVAEQQAEGGN